MRRRASYNMWVPTHTEKPWRTARIKFARGHQLQQAFRIRTKRQVSRYSFALLRFFASLIVIHTNIRKESKFWLLGLLCNNFPAEAEAWWLLYSAAVNCVEYLHAQLEFAIIIWILYIGILLFNILLVYYSTKEKICGLWVLAIDMSE